MHYIRIAMLPQSGGMVRMKKLPSPGMVPPNYLSPGTRLA